MTRTRKKRPGWTPERRAKVAAAWNKRFAEQDALEIAGSINTKRRGKVCTYCGEQFDLREHVPTLRVRVKLPVDHKVKFVLVPVCFECHIYLKYDEGLTVTARRAEIKSLLRVKYIAFEDWHEYPDNEIYRGMSRNYRELIDRLNNAKRMLKRRLAYKEGE